MKKNKLSEKMGKGKIIGREKEKDERENKREMRWPLRKEIYKRKK